MSKRTQEIEVSKIRQMTVRELYAFCNSQDVEGLVVVFTDVCGCQLNFSIQKSNIGYSLLFTFRGRKAYDLDSGIVGGLLPMNKLIPTDDDVRYTLERESNVSLQEHNHLINSQEIELGRLLSSGVGGEGLMLVQQLRSAIRKLKAAKTAQERIDAKVYSSEVSRDLNLYKRKIA